MRYAGLIRNDFSASPGVAVSFYVQGCPHRCRGCHNPDTWDFNGGKEFSADVIKDIIDSLTANGVSRSLCIMGGEPLCEENSFLVHMVISEVKRQLPNTKVYIWTGYYYSELTNKPNDRISHILELADYLIDGPFVMEKRDVTLQMRGSSNQSIIKLH